MPDKEILGGMETRVVGAGWARVVRVAIAVTAAVCVAVSLSVALFSFPGSDGGDVPFVGLVTAATSGSFALYVWQIRGRAMSVITGLLMVVPTVAAFVYAAIELIEGRAGGAGGATLWVAVPVVFLNYLVAGLGILIDSIIQRTAADRVRRATMP